MRSLKLFLLLIFAFGSLAGQEAQVYLDTLVLPTYSYSDPSPVAKPDRIFPYFRFDGYSTKASPAKHRMVVLENSWIKVWVAPDIGGKVYGAMDKKTGKYFIYYNNVVKFRDIAMRGPWVSGGIEFNFGSIGHAPTSSSPVDFHYGKNEDGSVSCFVGALELTSRTEWRVEIRLPADKAWFETIVNWQNPTAEKTSLYHWANASADAGDDLKFYYPGTDHIDHGGKASPWPVTEDGRDISWYRNNNYGRNHTYHIIGKYTDWFAGYYHNDDFGFGHWGRFAFKTGKKIWIWALSREGAIWRDLLTDEDNRQYVEIQTGFLFNQEADGSTMTPFKHMYLMPGAVEKATERWFPVSKLKGITEISEEGILNLYENETGYELNFQALGYLDDSLMIVNERGQIINAFKIHLAPQELFSVHLENVGDHFQITLKEGSLSYSMAEQKDKVLARPMEMPEDFDWESSYGLYTRGIEKARQRSYEPAKEYLTRCIEKDPDFIPAYTALAEINYKEMDYEAAEKNLLVSLSFDTYDPDANLLYGNILDKKGEYFRAKAAYGLASRAPEHKSTALCRLAIISLKENKTNEAWDYISKAHEYNSANRNILRISALTSRLRMDMQSYDAFLKQLSELDPLDHFVGFEKYHLSSDPSKLGSFKESINTELKYQSFIELALWYFQSGCMDEAAAVLQLSPDHPLVNYLLAYLYQLNGDMASSDKHLNRAIEADPEFVFPYREEMQVVLEWSERQKSHWKTNYYLSILYWAKNQTEKARNHFMACADDPDVYSFYLARGNFFESEGGGDIEGEYLKALEHGAENWRPYHALNTYYTSKAQHEKALFISEKAMELFEDSYIIRFDHATALLNNGKYEESVEILKKTVILPFEGAGYGRTAWRNANILAALENYQENRLKKALTYIDNAYLWPENLGVGRPYVVDERMEDFVNAMILERLGKKRAAEIHFEKLTNGISSASINGSSIHLLTIISLDRLNRKAEGDEYFEIWASHVQNKEISDWAESIRIGRKEEADELLDKISKGRDSNLMIVNEILQKMKLEKG